jgi:uncharacterized surface protein with fasciclin (FAS1) repeats
VEEELGAFDLAQLTEVTTAQGSTLAITVEEGFIVLNGTATITVANVSADNGVAHVVNAVLVPSA